ncbi:MAG: cytochrome c oxidase accessory protein CcoG [Rubricoccaceae bacterium]|nr:cytochrome c oxidase accessory protein CcoG [Rubricoccaceae bacterium]
MADPFVPASDLGILESPEEILSTLTREGKRKWLYPTPSKGRFWRQRQLLGWGLIALFVALPIVRIGGKPAVLLDIAHREFTLFGFTFYPTDTFFLLLFGIAALVSVALLTALLGRVWCGWGCPQTVYLEFVYRPLERLIEGKEHVRARRDAGPWTLDKAWRKGVKWAIYALLSVALAHVFVSYVVGWEALLGWMTGSPLDHWGFFVLMAGTSALVLFDFGVFREQMCTITCPYARFQSVLMDEDSMIVSYDPNRGEPRGKGKAREGLGDCVDCYACVRTCPTGIDIRDGLQMECVACTQCIDACDPIMDAIGRPRGLIRYTSEHALEGRPTRVLRPRTVLYGALLVAVATMFTIALTTRGAYDVALVRTPGATFTELPGDLIANRVALRVQNQTARPVTFTVEAVAPAGADVRLGAVQPVALGPRAMERLSGFVVVSAASFAGRAQQEATVRLVFSDGQEEALTFPVLGPSR